MLSRWLPTQSVTCGNCRKKKLKVRNAHLLNTLDYFLLITSNRAVRQVREQVRKQSNEHKVENVRVVSGMIPAVHVWT